MRVRLDSIGCRLNIGEMEELALVLARRGHRIVGPGDVADLFVFNTCAVTHVAARKSRKILRQIRRDQPRASIVATGCYADLSATEVERLGVDMVVGNSDKDQLAGQLEDAGLLRDADPIGEDDATPFPALHGRTRAFIKVQDGCDNRCTFCIVTVARGDSRSRPVDTVITQIQHLADLGYREAVLTGVHLGSYGHDRGNRDGLEHLVTAILERTDIARLRLSSLEPWDMRPALFDLWSDRRLQPHLHLPLQSGCDATLRRMSRRTSQAEFSALVGSARAVIPDLAVSTDVIAGFPGETEAEFEESIEFVESMAFSRLHVFRYSPRAGTAAAHMSGQIDARVAQSRSRRLHVLGADLEARFRSDMLGCRTEVLWESSESFGDGRRWSGLTGNYVRVLTDTGMEVDLRNLSTPTQLVDSLPGALYGRCSATRGRLCEEDVNGQFVLN